MGCVYRAESTTDADAAVGKTVILRSLPETSPLSGYDYLCHSPSLEVQIEPTIQVITA